MRSNFRTALEFVLKAECVFAAGHDGDFAYVVCEDVPGDSGGLTKFGIDQASHPNVNIRSLTYNEAEMIYHNGEWTKCRCDDLPDGYDIAVFDIAVNNGMGRAILLLQRALNEACGASLAVDAHVGPLTIGAAQAGGSSGLRRLLLDRQKLYYGIVDADPSQQKFLRGWLNRNNALAQLVGVDFGTTA